MSHSGSYYQWEFWWWSFAIKRRPNRLWEAPGRETLTAEADGIAHNYACTVSVYFNGCSANNQKSHRAAVSTSLRMDSASVEQEGTFLSLTQCVFFPPLEQSRSQHLQKTWYFSAGVLSSRISCLRKCGNAVPFSSHDNSAVTCLISAQRDGVFRGISTQLQCNRLSS